MDQLTSVHIAGWLACLMFVMGIVKMGIGLVKDLKDKPAPVDVQREAGEKYVSKIACAEQHRGVSERLNFLDQQRINDAKDGAQSRAKIYEEIKAVQTETVHELAAVRTELSQKMDEQAREFGQALRDMPSQIITILRNTGVIRK